jgi:hypothetical protein
LDLVKQIEANKKKKEDKLNRSKQLYPTSGGPQVD